ncbi:hypothetical protein [Pararhodobacter sp. SW119]|uniref:hypothetical protein n=1 Tax=Pararhodobacter sp. SW119 TaxID=2780075 RepID=UPI001ADF0D8A|nr:hypothetical protein [Pararhodobacter sp. SW119]
MKHIRTLALATAVSALGTGAFASTFTLNYTGGTASGTVQTNMTSGNIGAFGFNMTSTDPAAPDYLSSFVAWCLDLGATLQSPASYSVNNTNPYANGHTLSSDQKNAVRAVFAANYSTVESTLTNNVQAGFQIALWGAVYNNAALLDGNIAGMFANVGTNTNQLKITSGSATAILNAEAYLTSALARINDGPVSYNLTFLESAVDSDGNRLSQNLVTTAIPLPATGLLMLGMMGLGGIGVVARRRRDKAA